MSNPIHHLTISHFRFLLSNNNDVSTFSIAFDNLQMLQHSTIVHIFSPKSSIINGFGDSPKLHWFYSACIMEPWEESYVIVDNDR